MSGNKIQIETGMIHGRFQPFHNGHFRYLKNALDCAGKLIVGITNPDPGSTAKVESDSHRHKPDANPFSYFHRMRMIQKSILLDETIKNRYSDIIITPFPINSPENWKYYIPLHNVVQLMIILEPWDEEKQKLFKSHGFEVYTLNGSRFENGAEHSGTNVRQCIFNNKPWDHKVPKGTKEVLDKWLQKKEMGLRGT